MVQAETKFILQLNRIDWSWLFVC